MTWKVITRLRFEQWLCLQETGCQEKLLAALALLNEFGPHLPRPYSDTVKRSRYRNMKELRVQYRTRPIRIFYAFDPRRQAIVLYAGDKSNDKLFYEQAVSCADAEYERWLTNMEKKHENAG